MLSVARVRCSTPRPCRPNACLQCARRLPPPSHPDRRTRPPCHARAAAASPQPSPRRLLLLVRTPASPNGHHAAHVSARTSGTSSAPCSAPGLNAISRRCHFRLSCSASRHTAGWCGTGPSFLSSITVIILFHLLRALSPGLPVHACAWMDSCHLLCDFTHYTTCCTQVAAGLVGTRASLSMLILDSYSNTGHDTQYCFT